MDWRRWLSDLFILGGFALLVFVVLFWVKSTLAAQQVEARPYLVSTLSRDFPLPTPTTVPTSLPTPTPMEASPPTEIPSPMPTDASPQTQVVGGLAPTVTVLEVASDSLPNPEPTPEGSLASSEVQASEPLTTTVDTQPTVEIPTPAPSAGPVVRIVIPRLKVNRVVVPLGLITRGRSVDWNTDALFATRNRKDLVGHLVTSVNPGDGGNIVLAGHNYNNGGNYWNGVFVNLKKLKPGDLIKLYTQNGGEFSYSVQRVKQVPWTQKTGSELEKHQNYIWPKPHEQLTLVTCGGANLWTWSARVYVVALPVE